MCRTLKGLNWKDSLHCNRPKTVIHIFKENFLKKVYPKYVRSALQKFVERSGASLEMLAWRNFFWSLKLFYDAIIIWTCWLLRQVRAKNLVGVVKIFCVE